MNDDSPTSPPFPPHGAASTARQDISSPHSSPHESPALFQRTRRLTYLADLIRNLDILIYAQLSALYYMDNSLLYFLIRAIPHWYLFTPKPALLPTPPTLRSPIGIVFGSNLLCLILHVWNQAPAAGEATRGYLHGGLVIDFVGVLGPVSKMALVAEDLLVLGLQVLVLAVGEVRRRADEGEVVGQREIDDEERGVVGGEETEGIELEDLRLRDGGEGATIDGAAFDGVGSGHPLDMFGNGEFVVAQIHVVDTIRAQLSRDRTRVSSAPNPTQEAEEAEAAAGRVAGRRAFSWVLSR